MDALMRMRAVAAEHIPQFTPEGCLTLFAMLQNELTDEYFAVVAHRPNEQGSTRAVRPWSVRGTNT